MTVIQLTATSVKNLDSAMVPYKILNAGLVGGAQVLVDDPLLRTQMLSFYQQMSIAQEFRSQGKCFCLYYIPWRTAIQPVSLSNVQKDPNNYYINYDQSLELYSFMASQASILNVYTTLAFTIEQNEMLENQYRTEGDCSCVSKNYYQSVNQFIDAYGNPYST